MKTKVFYLYALSVLSIGFCSYAGSLFSFVEPFWSVALALTVWFLVSSTLLAAMRLAHSRWVVASLFSLAVVPQLPNLLVRIFPQGLPSLVYGLFALVYPLTVLATLVLYSSSVLIIRWDANPGVARDPQVERLQFEWAMMVPVLGAMTLFWGSFTMLFLGGGFGLLRWLTTLAIVLGAFFLLVWAARRLRDRAWVLVALFCLALLFLPDTFFLRFSRPEGFEPFTSQIALTLLLICSVALVVLALLVHSLLQLFDTWRSRRESQEQRRRSGRAFVLVLTLGFLLLGSALYNLYGFMILDQTTDALGNFWLGIPLPMVLLAGILLCFVLPGRQKLVGLLYSLLVPALLIGVAVRAQKVDIRKLTEERAGRITTAIEQYFTREGHYPQTLGQLTPRYLLSLSRPVIIYGQDWCYQAGEGYYRFGYLDREDWSSPILFGHVVSAQGHSPLKVDVCQAAMDAFRAWYPEWDGALAAYGRPTPTPDIGQ